MAKIIFNAVYWFVVQMVIAQLGTRIHRACLERDSRYFTSWSIEDNGMLWQKIFKVKYWKQYLPDGHKMNANIVSKDKVNPHIKTDDLYTFILETKRAELVHILAMLSIIIFIKSSKRIQVINVTYALVANMPCIIVQRYNRPKLARLYKRKIEKVVR